jgi:transposase
LEPFDLKGKLILADKGYDSDKFVHWVEERGGIVLIPSRTTAKYPRKTDWHIYKERHLVENLFLKLKNNRRFATRYEKKALYFYAVVYIACILVWLL